MKNLKEITSKENRIYKLVKSLKVRKYRDREALFVVEGLKQLEDAITSYHPVRYLIIRKDLVDKAFIKLPFEEPKLNTTEILSLDELLFAEISDTETDQGIIAVIEKKRIKYEEAIQGLSPGANILAMDRVQDLGNIGTLIRTAEGAGYEAVIMLKGSGDVYNPKTIRSAGGSALRIPIIYLNDAKELQKAAHIMKKKILVTDVSSGVNYYDTDIKNDIILVVGNEGQGVSDELMSIADLKINIPTEGNLESLNVAIAGGVIMMESLRQKKIL